MTDSISGLEERLARLTTASKYTIDTDPNSSSNEHKEVKVTDTNQATADILGPTGSDEVAAIPETELTFIPTHRALERVNLRPSPSLEGHPITTLEIGDEVQYIREDGVWFYVDTEAHGKGWCASGYLSPLPPIQQDAAHN